MSNMYASAYLHTAITTCLLWLVLQKDIYNRQLIEVLITHALGEKQMEK